jgi:hypothetical protein
VDKPIDLVPLVCLQCSTPIPAEIDEVAWLCAQCGQGIALDERRGLLPLQINFQAGLPPDAIARPFWVVEGQVSLLRKTYGSSGKHGEAAEAFWAEPRRFFVPAYSAPLETLLAQATELLLAPPGLQPGAPARFKSVTLPASDVRPAAEFIVMAIEAGRKDMLKSIDFDLNLAEPVLWVLP